MISTFLPEMILGASYKGYYNIKRADIRESILDGCLLWNLVLSRPPDHSPQCHYTIASYNFSSVHSTATTSIKAAESHSSVLDHVRISPQGCRVFPRSQWLAHVSTHQNAILNVFFSFHINPVKGADMRQVSRHLQLVWDERRV